MGRTFYSVIPSLLFSLLLNSCNTVVVYPGVTSDELVPLYLNNDAIVNNNNNNSYNVFLGRNIVILMLL